MAVPTNQDGRIVTFGRMTAEWDPKTRVAWLRYEHGTTLGAADGAFLTATLDEWAGSEPLAFAVLSDAKGVRGTDSAYRETGCIALLQLDPVSHVLVEMFRVATGVPLKCFADEEKALAWFRARGVAT